MENESSLEDLPPRLHGALSRHGFTTLTPIQQAVLEPALAGHDLRLSSQTGSGKTLAIGFVIARDMEATDLETESVVAQDSKTAVPAALIVVPTRELAAQLTRELTWLLRPSGKICCTITGGESYPMQMRQLRARPAVVVGTPGRLRDHVERGHIDLSAVRSVVFDEADQMLDMGFAEDLEAIIDRTGPARRLHMASATFPPAAQALAARYQTDPREVFGARPGEVNGDIQHVAHVVRPSDRNAALINVLLLAPTERALVFVRTRADASELATALAEAGFAARPISGDLEQAERTRTLESFRIGAVKVLVATDVAARGLDIADVARVIHADPPGDAAALTHRSGRTGRAGKKGISVMLVPPSARAAVMAMVERARIRIEWAAVPAAKEIWDAADERLIEELRAARLDGGESDRLRGLATKLLNDCDDPVELVRSLLHRAGHAGPVEPKEVTKVEVAMSKPRPTRTDFVPFHVSWGTRNGADARRLLAMVCRRGRIQGDKIGSIRLSDHVSTVEVAASVAAEFAQRVLQPDPRNPKVRIVRCQPAFRANRAVRPRSKRALS